MRRVSYLLGTVLSVSMLLAACGGEQTSTTVPGTNVPPITVESTGTEDASMLTGTPEGTAGDGTTTPGVPVTGEDNSSRLTNLMDFTIWNENGEQIGEVDDMVLDLDNSNISYVVVGTGGFLDIGEKTLLVPWKMLTMQADSTGGQQNAFILDGDQEMLNNAPDVDLESVLPGMGQSSEDWDTDIHDFWESGGTSGTGTGTTSTQAVGTASPEANMETTVPDTTATTTTGTGADTGTGTATSSGTGTTQGKGDQLEGVMLASDLLGSTLMIGNAGGAGQGAGQATSMPDTTTTTATAETGMTAVPETTATAASGTDAGTGTTTENQGSTSAMVEDAIVDPETGDILFLVLNSLFDDGERWIPVPLSTLRWDMTNESFTFVANDNALQNAPFFQDDQFPDTTTEGWDSEFDDFWQTNVTTP